MCIRTCMCMCMCMCMCTVCICRYHIQFQCTCLLDKNCMLNAYTKHKSHAVLALGMYGLMCAAATRCSKCTNMYIQMEQTK